MVISSSTPYTTTYWSLLHKNSISSVVTLIDAIVAQYKMCILKVLILCMSQQESIYVKSIVELLHFMSHFKNFILQLIIYFGTDYSLDSCFFFLSLHFLDNLLPHLILEYCLFSIKIA